MPRTSELYEQCIADWHAVDFQAMTRGGVRTETIWMNFEPGEIHYHTYAGNDYTDRQRIKRKARSWQRQFQALPPGERQAVFAALLSADIPAGIDDSDYDPDAPKQLWLQL